MPITTLKAPPTTLGKRLHHNLDSVSDEFGLRETQTEGLSGIAYKFMSGVSRVYVNQPGGAGKTLLGVALIKALATGTPRPGITNRMRLPRTVVAAPTHPILNRFREEIEKHAPYFLERDLVGEYHGGEKTPDRQIVLTTQTSLLLGTSRRVFTPQTTDLLMMDESHHMLSEARLALSEMFSGVAQLGLTASPHYGAEKTMDNTFECAHHLTPHNAVKRGATSPYKNFLLMTQGFELNNIHISRKGDYDAGELADATDHAKRYAQIANMLYNWKDPDTGRGIFGQQMLSYCATIKQSENAAGFLNRYFKDKMPEGVRFAAAIHSGLSDAQIIQLDKDFRAKKIRMFVTPKYIAEGADYPDVSVVVNITPTCSAVKAIQRAMRAMRYQDGKMAYVFDVVDQSDLNDSILACEAMGGTRIFRDDELSPNPDHATLTRALSAYWRTSAKQPMVISPDQLVLKFARPALSQLNKKLGTRKRSEISGLATVIDKPDLEIEKEKYPILNDKLMPSLRRHMNQAGYASVREMFNHWRSIMPSSRVAYNDMLDLARGRAPVFARSDLTAAAKIITGLMGTNPNQTFSSHRELGGQGIPATTDKNHGFGEPAAYHFIECPPEQCLPKIAARMNEMGLSVIDLVSIMQSEYNQHRVSFFSILKTIKGEYPIVRAATYKSPTQLKPLALQLADFFSMLPEELFSEDQYFELAKKLGPRSRVYRHMEGDYISVVAEARKVGKSDASINDKLPLPSLYKEYNMVASDIVRRSLIIKSALREEAHYYNYVGGPQVPPRWAKPANS